MADTPKPSPQEVIDAIYTQRGYTVPYHRIMAVADPQWLEKYEGLLQYGYFGPRSIDRKTQELLQTVVLAAMRAEVDHIAGHIRQAIVHGATPDEVLHSLECVLMPLGALGFAQGLTAWAKVVGVREAKPSDAALKAVGQQTKA